ncbi:hypothetical protein J6590_078124 [Homalodisca vitripennis]|nr:hypothetical protein J6590_078124 [Homalodisca vitripennis]
MNTQKNLHVRLHLSSLFGLGDQNAVIGMIEPPTASFEVPLGRIMGTISVMSPMEEERLALLQALPVRASKGNNIPLCYG